MKNNDKTGAFIWGLLAGGIIGSVLALLYAPSSGKKLRKDIADKADDFIEDIEEMYESGKEKAGKVIQDVKKKASNIGRDVKNIASN